MTTVRLFEHPFSDRAPQVFEVTSLAEWLLDHFGDEPKVGLQIYAGHPSVATDISGNVEAIMACDQSEYVVLQSPGDAATALAIFYNVLIAVATAVVLSILFPPPTMPGNVNRTQASPNNGLATRENQVRLRQRVEDIYGRVKSIPSVMMVPYNKYVDHVRAECGYYCIGRGYYDPATVEATMKDGDTLIADIPGSSAAVYDPFTSPNSGDTPVVQIGPTIIDAVVSARRSIEVDGIALKAPNQIQLAADSAYVFYPPGYSDGPVPGGTHDVIEQLSKQPNFNAIADLGQEITLPASLVVRSSAAAAVVAYASTKRYIDSAGDGQLFANVAPGMTVTWSGFSDPANNGPHVVVTVVDPDTIEVAETLVDDSVAGSVVLIFGLGTSTTRTIYSIGDGYVELDGTPEFGDRVQTSAATLTVDNGLTDWTAWITLPDTGRTEAWLNILALQGMYKDSGGKSAASVDFAIQIEQLDADDLSPTGVVETVTGNLSGATTDERAVTVERVTAWTGPARARVRRTSDFDYGFSGLVIDEIKWVDLYSVTPVDRADFGNKTTVHTVTRATPRATAARTRQVNCIAPRLLPTYDGTSWSGAFDADGRLASGTIHPTSKIVDIIGAVTIDPKIGARTIDELDLAQIWATQQLLDAWDLECGQFNYTLDSDETSFEQTLTMVANAAFSVAYRQGNVVRLSFERAQGNSTKLISHRNKRPKAENITRRFGTDADYDGVEFVYQDPDSEQAETIRLPLDGSATKHKRFEIPGIRHYKQAWYRACREYAKLMGQRLQIQTECTADARMLLPNSRVDIVDNTRFDAYDGEIVGQDGLTLTLSRSVAFTPGDDHYIVLMKRNGDVMSILCTPGAKPNRVVLAGLPAEALVTRADPDDGIRTIFSFASETEHARQAWLVQEIGLSDGKYIQVKGVNYSPAFYAGDTTEIPARDAVIN